MKMFLVTFGVLSLSIIGMALGVIFSNKALKGSCGGLNKVMDEDCVFCDKKEECKNKPKQVEDGLDLSGIESC